MVNDFIDFQQKSPISQMCVHSFVIMSEQINNRLLLLTFCAKVSGGCLSQPTSVQETKDISVLSCNLNLYANFCFKQFCRCRICSNWNYWIGKLCVLCIVFCIIPWETFATNIWPGSKQQKIRLNRHTEDHMYIYIARSIKYKMY